MKCVLLSCLTVDAAHRAPSHCPPVGGWYRDGHGWVHVKVRLEATDYNEGGLRAVGSFQRTREVG